jgi:hypothetical protein
MKTRLIFGFWVMSIFAIVSSCKVSRTVTANLVDSTYIKFNQAPFFPIAMYTWCADIVSDSEGSELDILKNAGFNLIDVKLKDTTRNRYDAFLDRCKTRAIHVIVEGNTEEATRGSNDPLFFKSIITNYRSHPSLFGFSISDDANNGKYPISDLSALHANIKKWDENTHYTLCSTYPRYKRADGRGINPATFFGVTDLLFFQTYPIGGWAQYADPPEFTPSEELYQNEVDCFTLQAHNTNNRPWVTTPQTFSWSFFHKNREQRLPSPDEMRNIVYVGLNNGAKGVIYYELHIPEDTATKRPEIKLYKNDTLWREIKAINNELETMKEVYMLGKRTKLTTIYWTSAAYWKYKDATYIIVANLHKTEPQRVDYAIPGSGALRNVFAGRTTTLDYADGHLIGIIPPKQVQVYKLY